LALVSISNPYRRRTRCDSFDPTATIRDVATDVLALAAAIIDPECEVKITEATSSRHKGPKISLASERKDVAVGRHR
jgi:hypothetical protein